MQRCDDVLSQCQLPLEMQLKLQTQFFSLSRSFVLWVFMCAFCGQNLVQLNSSIVAV